MYYKHKRKIRYSETSSDYGEHIIMKFDDTVVLTKID